MNRSILWFIAATLTIADAASAQTKPSDEMPLWPAGQVPGALGSEPKDIPTLTIYRAPTTRPAATFLMGPGGGYSRLSEDEGIGYATWLNHLGYTCFVLKYRLGSAGYRHPVMLEDVSRAIRTVRARADEWQIDPHQLIVVGSSAGGHLASTVLTHFDAGKADDADPIERQSSRPDFGVLVYPVISMTEITHPGSKKNLLGDNPSPELINLLSNEQQVTDQTPPTFIWHGIDDNVVPVSNSLRFAAALAEHHVPYELHIYQHAPHGIGIGTTRPPYVATLSWTTDLVAWLKVNKLDPGGPGTP